MMKKILFGMAAMMVVLVAEAENVSLKEAQGIAQQFLQQQGRNGSVSSVESSAARARRVHSGEAPCYYVFNVGEMEGYVIIAGDDLAPQVLGYSNSGSIDMDHLPCNMREWFEACEAQINYMRENNIPAVTPQATRRAIAPMVKTGWDQGAPYNMLLPTYTKNGQTGRSATGCVATAMAQVMSVFQYPEVTMAAIPSYSYIQASANKTVNVTGVNSGSTIAWNNMLDKYSGDESASAKQAVATLMMYCGKSVEMWYDASSSALVADVPKALKQYFGYSNNVAYKYRNNGYSYEQWEDMVYNELAAGRPVILSGKIADNTRASGHAFLCDGYDGNGRYHINWGWSNNGDDYFVLNMLKPSKIGIGGVSGSFNYHQEAVIGIEPAVGLAPNVRLTVTDFALATTQTTFQGIMMNGVRSYGPLGFKMSFVNKLSQTTKFDLNIGVYQNGKLLEVLCDESASNTGRELRISSQSEYSWNGHYLPGNSTLTCFSQPGTYQLVPVSRKSGSTVWHEDIGSDEHYITGVVSSNGTLTLTVHGESTPTDPEAVVSAQEKSLIAKQVENHKTQVEARMANVQDYLDKLSVLSSKAQDAEDSYYAMRLQYTELLELTRLYGLRDYALTLSSAIEALDAWNSANDYIGKTKTLVSEGFNLCGSYMAALRTLLQKVQKQATTADRLSTQSQYDQLRTEVDGFDEELSVIEGLNDILKVPGSINKCDRYIDAMEKSVQSFVVSYETLNTMVTDKIENDPTLKERKQLIEGCQEHLSWINYYRNLIQEAQDKTNSSKVTLLNLILMQGESLDAEKNKLLAAGERIAAVVLPEDQLLSLRQAYQELEEQASFLSGRIANSREQYENIQPVDENRLSEISRRMEALRVEMAQAASTDAIAAMKQELSSLQEETAAMSDLCMAQRDQLRMMVGDAENWSQEIRTISSGIKELNKMIDEAEALAIQLAAEIKVKQTELLAEVNELDNVLKGIESRLSECRAKVEEYQKKRNLLVERIDAIEPVINEIKELLKSPTLTDLQRKDFTERAQEIINRFTKQFGSAPVPTVTIDSFNAAELSIILDIQSLRGQLQEQRERISAVQLMEELPAVQDAFLPIKQGVDELSAKSADYCQSLEVIINSVSFDDMNTSISEIQSGLEELKSEIEAIITAVGRVVVDGKVVTACHDAAGRPANIRQKGLVLLRFADGTTKKVYNR